MGSDYYYLLTILYDNRLIKCALQVDNKKISNNAKEYCMEEESRKELRALLPPHVRSLGPIVNVEYIFNIHVI